MNGRLTVSMGLGCLLFVLSSFALLAARSWEFEAQLFPVAAAIVIWISSALHTVFEWRNRDLETATEKRKSSNEYQPNKDFKAFFWVFGLLLSCLVLGLPVGPAAFSLTFMLLHGVRPIVAFSIGASIAAFIYFTLIQTMDVSFPYGLVQLIVLE